MLFVYKHTFLLLSLQTAVYFIFLLFLSFSLLYGSTKPDPTQYSGTADLLCGFCEIVTLVMVIFYMCEEMNQMRMWVIFNAFNTIKCTETDSHKIIVYMFVSSKGSPFCKIPSFNPFTPKISLVILLTVCHIVLVMLVWRIWSWVNYESIN